MAFGLYQFYLGIKGEEQTEVGLGTLTFFSKLAQKATKKVSCMWFVEKPHALLPNYAGDLNKRC